MKEFNEADTRITGKNPGKSINGYVKDLLKDESFTFEQKVLMAMAELGSGLDTLGEHGCSVGTRHLKRIETLESWRSWVIGGLAGVAALMAFLLFILAVAKGAL